MSGDLLPSDARATSDFTSMVYEVSVERGDATEARKAVYRALAHASLVWGVDRERASVNPVFWHDGALNYVPRQSADHLALAFFKQRGIMSDGFEFAYRLNYSFEELDDALNDDFTTDINFNHIFGLLLLQYEIWHVFGYLFDLPTSFNETTKEREAEVNYTLFHLADLGYLELTNTGSSEPRYRWTREAAPVVKAYLSIDLDE